MKKLFISLFIIVCIFIYSLFFQSKNNSNEVLKFTSWGSQSETVILKELINNFKKETNIKVEFVHIPQNYFQKLHLLFASNLAPDVVFINNLFIKMYIKAGLLEDLSEYFKNDINSYYPEAINCFTENGKLYAIPRDISAPVIFVNKDILKKHGIYNIKKLNNIYELKELAQKVTTKDYYGINIEEEPIFLLSFLASNGGGILSDDCRNIIINTQNSKDALNLYSDFINEYHISPSKAQIGSMTTAQMFINKKLAMYISGRWMVPKFRQTINFDWDIIEFPSTEKNKIYIDSSGWAISKNSKHKEQAIKFIKYLSSKQSTEKMADCGLITPARIDTAEEFILTDKKNKPSNSQIFISMIKNTKPTPVNENYGRINDILKEKTQSVLNGEKRSEIPFSNDDIKKLESLLQ